MNGIDEFFSERFNMPIVKQKRFYNTLINNNLYNDIKIQTF